MTSTQNSNHRQVMARQDDTIDLICYRYFGKTKEVTEQVLDLNPQYKNTIIFNGGESLILPIITTEKKETTLTLWD